MCKFSNALLCAHSVPSAARSVFCRWMELWRAREVRELSRDEVKEVQRLRTALQDHGEGAAHVLLDLDVFQVADMRIPDVSSDPHEVVSDLMVWEEYSWIAVWASAGRQAMVYIDLENVFLTLCRSEWTEDQRELARTAVAEANVSMKEPMFGVYAAATSSTIVPMRVTWRILRK